MRLKLKGVLISNDGINWVLSRVDYLVSDVNSITGEKLGESDFISDIRTIGLKTWQSQFTLSGNGQVTKPVSDRLNTCKSCGVEFRSMAKSDTCPNCRETMEKYLQAIEGEITND